MNKLLIATALFAVSTFVQAQASGAVCSGTAGAGTPVTDGTSGTHFILKGFTPRCSGNVSLSFSQNARAVGVASASSKGSAYFKGNSEGGAVRGTDCTAKRCDGTEAAANVATALSESGAS
jgi:hypothetical protein